VRHAFAVDQEPFSLCPGDPRSLALIEDLLDQLLPCCASGEVNVGLDETFDLGQGRSRAACEERGVGRVYLEHLLAVHRLVANRGRRMQLWADILMHHPGLVPDVPRDAVAMLWGYDAGHPFAEEARTVAASGLSFYVCPGTSSWQSFGGRTGNMLANVSAAARSGVETGAEGLLVTDWGDRGHHQPLPISFAGWAHAADQAWNPAGAPQALERPDAAAARLAAALDAHVFRDPARRAGQAALELGRVEEALQSGTTNGTAPFFLLALVEEPVPSSRVKRLTPETLERGRAVLQGARAHLAAAAPARPDAALVKEELGHAADLIELGLELGSARLAAGPGAPCEALSAPVRAGLAERVHARLEDHGRLWLARSRPGGRADSARWLERVRERL
jgi:hexosaminidase